MGEDDIVRACSLIDQAAILRDQADFDGAIAIYSQLPQSYPTKSVLYFQRGTMYWKKGASDLAIADLTRAIELDKDDPDAFVNRANAYLQKHEYEAAIADLDHAIGAMAPNLAFALNSRGVAADKLGLVDQGIRDLKLAIDLDETYLSPVFNLASVLYIHGTFDESLA